MRVALIGAGKFGSMFLAQARRTEGMHLVAVADLSRERALSSLERTGWAVEQVSASSVAHAIDSLKTCVVEDGVALASADGIDVVVEATGIPAVGIRHALAAIGAGHHIVMVNVEADALAGPYLARRAAKAGVVYSLAYGDQPALICEMVDWARATGFEVVAAGKGTKYLPEYHASRPDTVWKHFGFTPEQVAADNFNAQMFNSFMDGTKSAIEMAAVANATGLRAAEGGLQFPPCGVDDLAHVLRPEGEGGTLDYSGQVEVVSSLERDGRPVFRDLRWGVYVVFRANSPYVRKCFRQYGLQTDSSGEYAAMYKPFHLIGLETGISVASAALRGEPTGSPHAFLADAVAVAKRDLNEGEWLDGEGGYTVWGRLTSAAHSQALGALPIGLAHQVRLRQTVSQGSVVRWDDVQIDEAVGAAAVRRAMELELGAHVTA